MGGWGNEESFSDYTTVLYGKTNKVTAHTILLISVDFQEGHTKDS